MEHCRDQNTDVKEVKTKDISQNLEPTPINRWLLRYTVLYTIKKGVNHHANRDNAHQKLINDKTRILEQQGSKGGKNIQIVTVLLESEPH